MVVKKLYHWLGKQILDYHDDVMDELIESLIVVQRQKYATWMYVALLVVSLYPLFTIALLSPQGLHSQSSHNSMKITRRLCRARVQPSAYLIALFQ